MDVVKQTLQEHIELLKYFDYELLCEENDLDEEVYMSIISKTKIVGSLTITKKNMYYMHKDNIEVCNKDLNAINFSKSKKKNMRTLFHIVVNDNNLHMNNYNMLVSEDRPFIEFTDNNNFRITKIVNEKEPIIMTLKEDIDENRIIKHLQSNKGKTLTYKYRGDFNEYKN